MCRKAPGRGRREKISKVLQWFGADFLSVKLLCFLLTHFSCETKELKEKGIVCVLCSVLQSVHIGCR